MILRLLILVSAAFLLPAQACAQEPDIVVQGDAARAEIERVLNADNLDTTRLSARDVVDIITGIPRGRAPEDFWNAYQLHVRAWSRLADAVERAQSAQGESTLGEGMEEVEAAEGAIETTFDEVERIATRYGARLPPPPVDTNSIA
ncbi:MAG: hypothetical protein E6G92_06720 [Alphaproteobacteria bacterium]|nr:MAG: hypothetical protein E6G92_06720 [Alphaproteobacteria bacterium]